MPSPVTVETDLREILNTINEHFDKLDARFEKTDEKLDKITQEINQTRACHQLGGLTLVANNA